VAPSSGRDGKLPEWDRTTGKRVAPPGGAKLYSKIAYILYLNTRCWRLC
jgi:hypothetical protein